MKLATLILANGLLAGPAIAPVDGLPARAPTGVSIGTWTGVCDNTGKCEAINAAIDNPMPMSRGVLVRLKVGAQGVGKQLTLQQLDSTGSPTSDVSSNWFIRLRHARQFGPPAHFRLSAADRLTARLNEAETRRFLAAVRHTGAQEAELVLPGSQASRIFALNGLAEIDRTFSASSISAAAPKREAVPTRHLPVQRTSIVSSKEMRLVNLACGDGSQRPPLSVKSWSLNHTVRLYAATCLYERDRVVDIWGSDVGDGVIRPIELPGTPNLRDRVAPFMVNASFDPSTARLSVIQNGRPGNPYRSPDCGASWSWIWTGSAFALESLKIMPVCAGLEEVDWLVAWRSKKRSR
jgi:Protein of unknown function (DUF1176)